MILKNFIQLKKIPFCLQQLQNIGYILHVIQHIREPTLHSLVGTTPDSSPLYCSPRLPL